MGFSNYPEYLSVDIYLDPWVQYLWNIPGNKMFPKLWKTIYQALIWFSHYAMVQYCLILIVCCWEVNICTNVHISILTTCTLKWCILILLCFVNIVMREHDFMEMLHYALHDITISCTSDHRSHYMIMYVIIWLHESFMYCIVQL